MENQTVGGFVGVVAAGIEPGVKRRSAGEHVSRIGGNAIDHDSAQDMNMIQPSLDADVMDSMKKVWVDFLRKANLID